MQLGAVALTANSDIHAPNNKELSFKLKRWHVDRRGQSPILHARANVDWLTLDTTCVTQMFPLASGRDPVGHLVVKSFDGLAPCHCRQNCSEATSARQHG